jgi:hypothetical protein
MVFKGMAALRNLRHEFFVRHYIETGGNGAEAYRRVSEQFPNKPLINPHGARVIAHGIRKRPEVRRREQELRHKMAKKADITMEKVLSDYQDALDMAKMNAKPAEMISAATAQAKLVGLLRDRVETGQPGDFDGLENISDILEKVEQDMGAEAALALAKAFGYAKTETAEDVALAEAETPSDAVN